MKSLSWCVWSFLSFLLCSCGGSIESEDDKMGVVPWHLWGGSKTVIVPHSLALIEESTTQLTKVAYGRPESWNFLFGARIIDVSDVTDAGSIEVKFDVTVGVGRDNYTIKAFEHYIFVWSPPPNLAPPVDKYSTEVETPVRSDSATTPNPGICRTIVAQDINVQARVTFSGGAVPNKTAQVEVYNFWAPVNHLRPEWYLGRFPGAEIGGS